MKVADQVRERLRRLHPAQRQAVKAALRALAAGATSDTLALTDDLEGFYRLRVGRFRIVYRLSLIHIWFAGAAGPSGGSGAGGGARDWAD